MKLTREDAIHLATQTADHAIKTLNPDDYILARTVAYKVWADDLIDECELQAIVNYMEKGINVRKGRMLIIEVN